MYLDNNMLYVFTIQLPHK